MKHSLFQLNSIKRHDGTPVSADAEAVVPRKTPMPSACLQPENIRQHTSTILRLRQVEARIGLRRSSIYARISPHSKQFDAQFPRPVSLGSPMCQHRTAVGWFEHEIEAWLARRSVTRSGA